MNVEPFTEEYCGEWEELVANSFNGTFLHSRRFLSYHGGRFEDASLLIRDSEGRLVGVLPAAVSPADAAEIVSHPGITYGGLIHARRLVGNGVLHALEGIVDTYQRRGFHKFVYKPVPRIFQVVPSEDDLYALFRLGAERSRCDLSAAIDLSRRAQVSKRRERAFKKARKLGVVVHRDLDNLERYWGILSENLGERHAKTPVHTLDEIRHLASTFPDEIALVSGHIESELVAGTVLFTTKNAVHTQYLANSKKGMDSAALDYVIEDCIQHALADGTGYFSFGVSTEQDGMVLNEGLHTFKTEFGAGGIVHEIYSITL